jgi:hypothetical protein
LPLRIAFDLDGVLADMESALVREAVVLFGEGVTCLPESVADLPAAAAVDGDRTLDDRVSETTVVDDAAPDEAPERLTLTAHQQHRLWRHVGTIENFWETLNECEPGIVARLASIAADRRWEIIFLTKRPESSGATAQVQTQRWLAVNGFPLPSVYVVQRSRGRIAAALDLDFVIDDAPENCRDVVVDSRARAILVWRADQRLLPPTTRPLGIDVVTTVHQCLDILTELDRTPDQRPRVVDRLMRFLGLKEPVSA